MATILIMPSALSQTTDLVNISINTTPNTYFGQFTSGDKCRFEVEITNLGVNINNGQIINASQPWEKYSGNFTIESVFELRKYGGYTYGGQSASYVTSLNNTQIDNYYSIFIPPVGEKLTYVFTYNLTKGYEVFGVRPDENMALYFRLNVFLQSYSEKDGVYQVHVGDRIETLRNDYYIIDFVKQEYLKGKLKDIMGDIDRLNNINSDEVQLGKAYYQKVLDALNSSITSGNYVQALEQVQRYYQVDQPTLIALLFYNLNSTATTAEKYGTVWEEYQVLSGQYAVLQSDYETILTTNQIQADQIGSLEVRVERDRNNTIIITGITAVVMLTFGFLLAYRPRLSNT